MSACALLCINCNAEANFSNSSRDRDPSSLQGARCNANSITPSDKAQDKALPLPAASSASALPLCTSVPSVVKILPESGLTPPAESRTSPQSRSSSVTQLRPASISHSPSTHHPQSKTLLPVTQTPALAYSAATPGSPHPAQPGPCPP